MVTNIRKLICEGNEVYGKLVNHFEEHDDLFRRSINIYCFAGIDGTCYYNYDNSNEVYFLEDRKFIYNCQFFNQIKEARGGKFHRKISRRNRINSIFKSGKANRSFCRRMVAHPELPF